MQIPATYLKLYLEHFADQPQLIAALLAGTGLDSTALASSDRYLPFETVTQVLENANKQFDKGWHVRLAAEMEIMQHGPLGFAAATAANLRDAIATLARYVEVRAPFAWLSTSEDSGRVVVCCVEAVELGPLRASLMETTLVACANLIRHVGAHGDVGVILELPGPPPVYAASFGAHGLAEPRFSASRYALSFPAAWLARPCLLYDRAMHEASVAKCRELLATTTRRSDLEFAIRELLHAANGHSPGLTAVAASVNMSPRSLIRRLKDQGTAYREIVESVHKALAREALLNSRLSIAQIGYELGYSDPSNFGRAFRRWFGVSAGRYRSETVTGAHARPPAGHSRDSTDSQ